MHCWGDEWFEKNGDDLYNAIDFIDQRLRKCGIWVYSKEKYGSRRESVLSFWNGGLYLLLFGYRCWIGTHKVYPQWLSKIVNNIHHFIYYTLDYKVLCPLSRKIGLTKLVQKWQASQYNKAYQLACKQWSNVIDELICDVEGYMMIKPCKWGNIDGEEIHKKYWKSV